jgi:hypothetical protein
LKCKRLSLLKEAIMKRGREEEGTKEAGSGPSLQEKSISIRPAL